MNGKQVKAEKEQLTMEQEQAGMRPIWYFVGYLLSVIGLLVVLAGILNLFYTLPSTSVLGSIHPDIWWGGLITVVGLVYIWNNRNTYIR